MMRSTHF